MRLVFDEEHNAWTVVYNDRTVAIGGQTYFPLQDDALSQIWKRGLVVDDDGLIHKPQVEAPLFQAPVATETVPEVVEPVSAELTFQEPGAPEEPQETPKPPAEETSKPKRVRRAPGEPARPRGRPALFSPEEAKERRREQNRRYYHQRSEARKAEVSERSREWRQTNQDKIHEYRAKSNEDRRRRYQEDPEFRAKVAAANKRYQERRKAQRSQEKDG
jgi:hypothetical protein